MLRRKVLASGRHPNAVIVLANIQHCRRNADGNLLRRLAADGKVHWGMQETGLRRYGQWLPEFLSASEQAEVAETLSGRGAEGDGIALMVRGRDGDEAPVALGHLSGQIFVRSEVFFFGCGVGDIDGDVGALLEYTGIGIDPLDQHRIFTAFEQGDGSSPRRYGGTGLGLALCHHLATAVGGDIQVNSQAGEGSTFYLFVRLPSPT